MASKLKATATAASKRDKTDSDGEKTIRARAKRMSPAQRKSQLLAAAIGLIADKGIGDTNHSNLALAAGVAIPTIFHYYTTKEELIAAVLEEVSRFLIEDIVVSHFDQSLHATESIEDLLMTFCDAIDTHPDYIKVWLEWSVSIRGELWVSYLAFYDKAISGIKTILQRGVDEGAVAVTLDIDDAARVIVGVAHMVAHMKFADSSRETIQHTIHSLVFGYLADKNRQVPG